ncbi:DUF3833 family protein [Pseudaestuariivita atlantica]|uniref:DUF3833 domain-containing protein n=1 Tax=Pseudaestuariivita atlantica TaxID=1317121 RepID=A0A0L1JSK1_9RHOB|nr:DUF3833 family protein [Pseudaestuariivita atlantica]KNG94735.1 hypothetical protein ATO11_04915 [Pseudaestuariivita atlantica]
MEILLWLLIGAGVTLAAVWARARYLSFVAQTPDDYVQGGEPLDLRRHLNGPMICEGVIYGPTGRVASRFVADFQIDWIGNRGTMREAFTYDSGERQDRQWNLVLGNDGAVRATAEDVVGEAQGTQAGSAVLLRYKYKLPEKSGGHVLNTVDWMYLTPNGTIVNRSQFYKFGFKVAELVATMRPATETAQQEIAA